MILDDPVAHRQAKSRALHLLSIVRGVIHGCWLRASAKNKHTIRLVLWSVYCVASTSTYPQTCTSGCALPDFIKTGEPKYGAIRHIYFFP